LPFIDNALTSGGHILVHCWAGKSRSVSTIAAFLIKYEHKTPEEVLAQIRVNRPHAQPNVGYMEELFDFYAEQSADWKVHNDN
jgi:protein-tyrosine phosphatase